MILVKYVVASKYLAEKSFEMVPCSSEQAARDLMKTLPDQGRWPCFFSHSDTTGEKDFEEFFTDGETLDFNRFENLGVIKNKPAFDGALLDVFECQIKDMRISRSWCKKDIVDAFNTIIPEFVHIETGKYLDGKM